MQMWIRWLGFVNLIPALFLLKHTQARYVLGAILFIMVTNLSMMFLAGSGLVKALSIPHLFVWVPLVVYLAHQFRSGKIQVGSIVGVWLFAVMVTDFISTVFDFRDSAEYLLGDHGPVALDAAAGPPYAILAVMLVLGIAMLAYAFGGRRASIAQ